MRDIASLYTRGGTPVVLIVSRLAFVSYFALFVYFLVARTFADSYLSPYWMLYMLVLYVASERIYAIFYSRRIDLTFAFPILFAVFVLNLISLITKGQEHFPVINRAEHFASFILLTYIVWIFFLKYLPQDVWQKHPYYTALLTLAVTSLFGVGNEIVELVMDVMIGLQTIGGKLDTSIDLLMNTLGSTLLLSVQLIFHEAQKK